MPRRELRYPHQVATWLDEWAGRLREPGAMTLIGSAALLWHAAEIGLDVPLPENSMDVDSITDSDAIAELAYEAMIGSEFERTHGWHVNLIPESVFKSFPNGWEGRCSQKSLGNLTIRVPSVADLLAAKACRNDPRDQAHAAWAQGLGLA